MRHQINVNGLAELPFGQGKRWGGNVNNVVNGLIGDWSVAGLMRLTSGFPFNVSNCRSCWATNWNVRATAMLVDPEPLPETETTLNAVDNRPSPFADAQDALTYFRRAAAGRSRHPQHAARRRLLHHRHQHQQVVVDWASPITACASAGTCST